MSTTGQPAGRDFAAVTAWESEREAAEQRGERWVDAAGHLAALLEASTPAAERAGVPALSIRLTSLRDQAAAEYAHRRCPLMSWGAVAWNLQPTAALPAEPWKG